jgi:hypothetical protein
MNGPIASNRDQVRNRDRVLTPSDHRGHEMYEEEDQQLSFRVEKGNEAKPGTWAEVLPDLVKDFLFAVPHWDGGGGLHDRLKCVAMSNFFD